MIEEQHEADDTQYPGSPISGSDVPPQIDQFRITKQLGVGGIGIVCEAQQLNPVQRMVAIKLVNRKGDVTKYKRHLESECKALAWMRHENVVDFIEARIDRDRPYFVMERVFGVNIAQYSNEHDLSLEHRLQLFLQVCAAVQHVHDKHIAHFDVTAANVLVTDENREGVVKLIDFGIARTFGTAPAAFDDEIFDPAVGTRHYISPERLTGKFDRLNGERSDIYSLGVLLYLLVAGRFPHDLDGLDQARIAEVVSGTEPPLPSERVRSAGGRGALKTVWVRDLRGDLDAIVMKALRRDPGERYAKVALMAADLRSYLECRPIALRANDWLYGIAQFCRRRRVPVGVSMAFLFLVSLVVTLLVLSNARIQSERDNALASGPRESALRVAEAERRIDVLLQRSRASAARGYAGITRGIVDLLANAECARAKSALAACMDGEVLEQFRDWEWFHLSWLADSSESSMGLSRSGFTCICPGREGAETWVGARDGSVWGFDEHGVRKVCQPVHDAPLLTMVVRDDARGIALAEDGALCWFSTASGYVAARASLPRPAARSGYGAGDALPAQYAAAIDDSGRFLFWNSGKTASVWSADGTTLATERPFEFSLLPLRDGPVDLTGDVAAAWDGRILYLVVWTYAPPPCVGLRSWFVRWRVENGPPTEWTRLDLPLGTRFTVAGPTALFAIDGRIVFAHVEKLLAPSKTAVIGEISLGVGEIGSIALSRDGMRAAVGSGGVDKKLFTLHLDPNRPSVEYVRPHMGHEAGINALRFIPGTETLLSVGGDGTARRWELDRSPPIRRLVQPPDACPSSDVRIDWLQFVGSDPDAQIIGADAGQAAENHGSGSPVWVRPPALYRWDLATPLRRAQAEGKAPSCRTTRDDGWRRLGGFAATQNGRTLAIGAERDAGWCIECWTWDGAVDPTFYKRSERIAGPLGTIDVAPGTRRLIAAAGGRRRDLCGNQPPADGEYDVYIWDADGAGKPTRLRGPTDTVEMVELSPNGQYVAAASWDGELYVWAVDGTSDWHQTLDDGRGLTSVSFTHGGDRLLVGTSRGRMVPLAMRAREGKWDLVEIADSPPDFMHTSDVTAIAVNPSSTRIATGSSDFTVMLWDGEFHQQVMILRDVRSHIRALDWSSSGRFLAVSGDAGGPLIYDRGTTDAASARARVFRLFEYRGTSDLVLEGVKSEGYGKDADLTKTLARRWSDDPGWLAQMAWRAVEPRRDVHLRTPRGYYIVALEQAERANEHWGGSELCCKALFVARYRTRDPQASAALDHWIARRRERRRENTASKDLDPDDDPEILLYRALLWADREDKRPAAREMLEKAEALWRQLPMERSFELEALLEEVKISFSESAAPDDRMPRR